MKEDYSKLVKISEDLESQTEELNKFTSRDSNCTYVRKASLKKKGTNLRRSESAPENFASSNTYKESLLLNASQPSEQPMEEHTNVVPAANKIKRKRKHSRAKLMQSAQINSGSKPHENKYNTSNTILPTQFLDSKEDFRADVNVKQNINKKVFENIHTTEMSAIRRELSFPYGDSEVAYVALPVDQKYELLAKRNISTEG